MYNARVLAVMALLPLSTFAMVPNRQRLGRRFDMSGCVDSSVDAPEGSLFCVNSDGTDLSCDECVDADSSWAKCYSATADDSSLGTSVACPKDQAPATGPDGKPTDTADGFIRTFCDDAITLPGLWGQFGTITGCLLWGSITAENELEANEGGLFAVCDAFTAGACSAFKLLNGDLTKEPETVTFCRDNPDETTEDGTTCEDLNNLMAFAGP